MNTIINDLILYIAELKTDVSIKRVLEDIETLRKIEAKTKKGTGAISQKDYNTIRYLTSFYYF